MTIDIEVGLETDNQIVCQQVFRTLIVDSYCVRNWTILISVLCDIAPNFVEFVAVSRLFI